MITINDISEARRDDIEALYLGGMNTAENILVAVAEQLECFEGAGTVYDREYQVALQIWEAAYTAAGGVVQRET